MIININVFLVVIVFSIYMKPMKINLNLFLKKLKSWHKWKYPDNQEINLNSILINMGMCASKKRNSLTLDQNSCRRGSTMYKGTSFTQHSPSRKS